MLENFYDDLNPLVREIFSRLEKNGHEAFLVGGVVRDYILGRDISDVDMTTSCLPDEIMDIFSDYKLIDIGIKYGTIKILDPPYEVELTTYRSDGDYKDKRHPDQVSYETSIEKDLSRRDFTVNAMAWSPSRGLIDLYGGISDIEEGIIRTVGDPEDRFDEDALRIIRAARFSSRLNFSLSGDLIRAAGKKSENLRLVSPERIRRELDHMLLQKKPSLAIERLDELGALEVILPEVHRMKGFDQHSSNHQYDLYYHSLKCMDGSPEILEVRLAALLHDIGKIDTFFIDEKGEGHFYGHQELSSQMALYILKSLRYSNKVITRVRSLIERHMDCSNAYTKKSVRKLLGRLGEEASLQLFSLQRADIMATVHSENTKNIDRGEALLKEILDQEEAVDQRGLLISGDDIKELGFKEGPMIGKILREVTDLVMDEKLKNDREILLNYIKKRYING